MNSKPNPPQVSLDLHIEPIPGREEANVHFFATQSGYMDLSLSNDVGIVSRRLEFPNSIRKVDVQLDRMAVGVDNAGFDTGGDIVIKPSHRGGQLVITIDFI